MALHGGTAPENRNDVNHDELVTTHNSFIHAWWVVTIFRGVGDNRIFVRSFKNLLFKLHQNSLIIILTP